jgi:hypothetical protein
LSVSTTLIRALHTFYRWLSSYHKSFVVSFTVIRILYIFIGEHSFYSCFQHFSWAISSFVSFTVILVLYIFIGEHSFHPCLQHISWTIPCFIVCYFSIIIWIVEYADDLVRLADEETVPRAWLIDWNWKILLEWK